MVETKKISEFQSLYLELIKSTAYNNLDGDLVASDLKELLEREVIESCILTRTSLRDLNDVLLRDLTAYHNADTLLVRVASSKKLKFQSNLAFMEWHYDTLTTHDCQDGSTVFEFWWD